MARGAPELGVDSATGLLTPPPCSPWKPNCCSSDARGFFHVTAPLDLSPDIVDVASAWEKAVATLHSWDRTLITTETNAYVRAECSTKVFHWVDDLELHLRYGNDKANATIAIRSASRQGWWDFGENRRRVEVLRAQLLASGILAKPSRPPGFNMNELSILVVVFSSIIGYAMVLPLLPTLLDAQSLGATRYGAINSLGNLVALVAATGLGWHSDLHGRRSAVLVCAVVGTIGIILLGIRLLLPTAGGGANQMLAVLGSVFRRVDRNSVGAVLQAVGVDTIASRYRSAYMGRLNMAMSLGFTAGSSLGGLVTQSLGQVATLCVAVQCSVVYLLMAFVSIPGIPATRRSADVLRQQKRFVTGGSSSRDSAESINSTQRDRSPSPAPATGFMSIKNRIRGCKLAAPNEEGKEPEQGRTLRLQSILASKRIMALLVCKGCISLAFFVLTGTFDLFLSERFHLNPASFGFFLSFIGLCFGFVNGAWLH